MSAPRPRIDVIRESPLRLAPTHGHTDPTIANSPIALKIEASMRKRLGPVPNVKGDRPKEEGE